MNSIWKYVRYHAIKTIFALPIMIFVIMTLMNSLVLYTGWYSGVSLNLDSIFPYLFFFSIFLPVLELQSLNNRRNLDLWYSLPIGRMELITIHYFNGLFQLLVATAVAIVSTAIHISWYPDDLRVAMFFPYIPFLVMSVFVAYTLAFWAFSIANNNFDGFVFIVAYFNLATIVNAGVKNFIHYAITHKYSYSEYETAHFSLTQINRRLSYYYESLIKIDFRNSYNFDSIPSYKTSIIVMFVLAILLAVVTVIVAKNRNASKVGGSSDSWFGYKVLIPIYGFAYSLAMIGSSVSVWFVYVLMLFTSYAAFRRSVKFKAVDYIIIAVLLVIGIVFIAIEKTEIWYVNYEWIV